MLSVGADEPPVVYTVTDLETNVFIPVPGRPPRFVQVYALDFERDPDSPTGWYCTHRGWKILGDGQPGVTWDGEWHVFDTGVSKIRARNHCITTTDYDAELHLRRKSDCHRPLKGMH